MKLLNKTVTASAILLSLLYIIGLKAQNPVVRGVNGNTAFAGTCNCRLTLVSGTPVPITDQSAKTSVFFTPYNGNHVSLYTSSTWTDYTFTEITIALGTLVSATNYDIFIYDVTGTATAIIGPAWSTATARGTGAGTTELTTQNGVNVNANSITSGPAAKAGLYVGTFRTTATTTTEDSFGGVTTQTGGKRFVFNQYNRVARPISVIDTTDSWAYATATWREAEGSTTNIVEYLIGLPAEQINATLVVAAATQANTGTNHLSIGIGSDSTTAPSGLRASAYEVAASLTAGSMVASYTGYPALGYHYLAWLESGIPGTQSRFYGDNGTTIDQAGLVATVWN